MVSYFTFLTSPCNRQLKVKKILLNSINKFSIIIFLCQRERAFKNFRKKRKLFIQKSDFSRHFYCSLKLYTPESIKSKCDKESLTRPSYFLFNANNKVLLKCNYRLSKMFEAFPMKPGKKLR